MKSTGKGRSGTRHGRLAAAKTCAVVIETDPDYLIRWATPSIEPLLGWSPSTLVATPITEIFHPEDGKPLTAEWSEQSLLLRVMRKDGAFRWMKGFSSPLSDDGNAVFGWIFSLQDVDELVSRRALLSAVLANVDAHIYMKDESRRYLYANPRVQELMGRPLDQIIGQTDKELLPTDTAASIKAMDDEVFRTGSPVCREEIIPDRHGQLRIFLSKKMLMQQADQPDCLIGFSTEITELKRVEASLRVSEKQLAEAQQRCRVMLENYPGIVVETDLHGIVTVMSPTIATLTGIKPEKCIGHSLVEFVEDDDKVALRSLLSSCIQGASGHALLHVETAKGDHRTVSVVMHPVYAEDGGVAGTSSWWREAPAV